MRMLPCLMFALAACASAPRAEIAEPVVLEGVAVGPAREAARAVVEEVAHPKSVVRVTEEGSVMTDGHIGRCDEDVICESMVGVSGTGWSGPTPWTTIEVRFDELESGTAVDVEIVYEGCGPRIDCEHPQRLESTGALEREILDRIRARLDSTVSHREGEGDLDHS
jgi:hypothetical protein